MPEPGPKVVVRLDQISKSFGPGRAVDTISLDVFDGVQASSRYPGGVALRFARVKGYRPDKSADEADTIDHVQALHVRA
jgi:hypothetical protein